MSIVITTTIIMDARISLRQQGNHHYHQRQTAVVIAESHKYKDTERYYHHQPTTPPPKNENYTIFAMPSILKAIIEQGRHDGRYVYNWLQQTKTINGSPLSFIATTGLVKTIIY
ncbi:hypothetical protein EVAR_101530_1 [Eumeta japonica]|uniref:Uncharacterized protein n=1 Tax=Eumeta variegata TaxID=151549 RepID=A0A4C1TGI2_EUMVA|nr:hypothetical protein EVAR_101530_1 [Eumeta japonica]